MFFDAFFILSALSYFCACFWDLVGYPPLLPCAGSKTRSISRKKSQNKHMFGFFSPLVFGLQFFFRFFLLSFFCLSCVLRGGVWCGMGTVCVWCLCVLEGSTRPESYRDLAPFSRPSRGQDLCVVSTLFWIISQVGRNGSLTFDCFVEFFHVLFVYVFFVFFCFGMFVFTCFLVLPCCVSVSVCVPCVSVSVGLRVWLSVSVCVCLESKNAWKFSDGKPSSAMKVNAWTCNRQ